MAAGILRRLGVHMGADCGQVHQESSFFREINVRALLSTGASWYHPGPMRAALARTKDRDALVAEVRDPRNQRLAEATEVDQSRGDTAIFIARRMANPWGSYPSEDAWRVEKLRQTFPYYELNDISPHIDALRMIKSEREIETLHGLDGKRCVGRDR